MLRAWNLRSAFQHLGASGKKPETNPEGSQASLWVGAAESMEWRAPGEDEVDDQAKREDVLWDRLLAQEHTMQVFHEPPTPTEL